MEIEYSVLQEKFQALNSSTFIIFEMVNTKPTAADGELKKGAERPEEGELKIDAERHVEYILSLETKTREADLLYFTDHKRLSGVYWAIGSLQLLHKKDKLPSSRIMEYVKSCRRENGSYGGNSDQDGHILYTLSALQIYALYEESLTNAENEETTKWILSLQNLEDGSYAGDEWGEIDSRFTYCSLLCLKLLGKFHLVNQELSSDYILKCINFDGAFGCIPGAESHAGNTFCCVGSLALTNSLHKIDTELLGWWLSERQLPCGGLNGRPDKKEDVCYSWWVLSSLFMIKKEKWINADALANFIQKCQDPTEGGFGDRPDDMPDVFHTFFGLGGLSLLGRANLDPIDPISALPTAVYAKFDSNK